MDIPKVIGKFNISKIFNKLDIKKIFNFSNKVDAVLIIDIGSKLTLLNVELIGDIKVTALKVVGLEGDKRNEIISSSISSFIKENKILHKNAILIPALSYFHIKRIQLPIMPDAELLEAIKWHIKDDVSFDLAKAVIDFSIIKKTTKDDGSKVADIICAVAQEEEIKQQVALLKQSGLNCLSVGLLPFSYEKLIEKSLTQEKDEAISMLHFSEDICYIAIYKNNKLELYRELPISVNMLKVALKGVLASDKGNIELSSQEAEEALFTIGIPQQETSYKDKLSSGQIISMLRPLLERLAGDIKRSLAYYDSYFQGGLTKRIFISGSAVKIKNIDKFLSKELSLSFEMFSLADKIAISPNVDSSVFAEAFTGLGLALNYKSNLNLMPYEFKTEKIEKIEKVSLRWIAFIAFLLFLVSFIFAKSGVSLYQKRLDNAKLHLGVLSEVKLLDAKIKEMDNFVNEVRGSELFTGGMLKKLSNIAPQELFITGLSLNYDTKTGAITGLVRSFDKNPQTILTNFITEMKYSAYFSEISIQSVEKKEDQGIEFSEFHINIKLL